MSSENELIARAVSHGDRAAFGELVRMHQSAVRRFLRQLTHPDAALADDLAQDTFIQAYRSLDRFRGDAAFLTWLLGIAHNRFRNARRKQRELPSGVDADAIAPGTFQPTDSTDWKQDLAAAIKTLPAEEQAALHLCYQQDLSHGEAAQILGCPVGTLKTQIARAKEQLRRTLSAWKNHHEPRTH